MRPAGAFRNCGSRPRRRTRAKRPAATVPLKQHEAWWRAPPLDFLPLRSTQGFGPRADPRFIDGDFPCPIGSRSRDGWISSPSRLSPALVGWRSVTFGKHRRAPGVTPAAMVLLWILWRLQRAARDRSERFLQRHRVEGCWRWLCEFARTSAAPIRTRSRAVRIRSE